MSASTTIRHAVKGVGGRALAAVLLAPLLTAVVIAVLTPRLVATSHQASARVELYSIGGSHATFDVSSIAADFIAVYTGTGKLVGATTNLGEPAPTLSAEHPSDSSVVNITYSASSEESAQRGLRTAASTAAKTLARQETARTSLAVKAARSALNDVVSKPPTIITNAEPGGAKFADVARTSLVQQASQQYAAALVADATAKAALQSVGDLIHSTPVTVSKLTNTFAQIRVIGVAAVSAFAVACIVLLIMRRRTTISLEEADPSGTGP